MDRLARLESAAQHPSMIIINMILEMPERSIASAVHGNGARQRPTSAWHDHRSGPLVDYSSGLRYAPSAAKDGLHVQNGV